MIYLNLGFQRLNGNNAIIININTLNTFLINSQLKQHLQKEPQLSEEDDIKRTKENKRNIIDPDTDTAFKGSVAHNFVELTPGHYSQQQICSFLQSEFESLYSLVRITKLLVYTWPKLSFCEL